MGYRYCGSDYGCTCRYCDRWVMPWDAGTASMIPERADSLTWGGGGGNLRGVWPEVRWCPTPCFPAGQTRFLTRAKTLDCFLLSLHTTGQLLVGSNEYQCFSFTFNIIYKLYFILISTQKLQISIYRIISSCHGCMRNLLFCLWVSQSWQSSSPPSQN